MPEACNLWVTLASAGPRLHPHREPTAYLHFPSTGLLVGLPDEPGVLLDPVSEPSRFPLREADAAGLGLTPDDFALGAALCSGAEGDAGWHCDTVEVVVSDDEGELHSKSMAAAPIASTQPIEQRLPDQPGRPEALPASNPARRGRPRALVYVTDRALASGALAAVAARTEALNARVVLGAVGELPESRRHAEDETRALDRLLAFAAPMFGGRVAALRVELGGDPIHGLMTLAEEEHATLILLPEEAAPRSDLEDLAGELRRRVGVPVESMAVPATSRVVAAAADSSPAARERVARRLVIAIGDRDDVPPWERPEEWREAVRYAVRERLRKAAPIPAGTQCTLTARSFVHPGHVHPERLARQLPLEAIAEALVGEAYVTPSQLPAARTNWEVVETDPDLVEHVVAVLRC